MEELVSRIVSNVGLEPDVARRAVGIILGFLKSAGPAAEVEPMLDEIPGAREATATEELPSGGMLFGGMGALAAMNALTGIGLDMGQVTSTVQEVVAFAREKVGADRVDSVLGSIPGLGQFT